MSRRLRVLCGAAFAFAFCFLAVGYAAVQDELLVTGSVSIVPQEKVFAVYGEAFDSNNNSLGKALYFYNRVMPAVDDEIYLSNDGQMTDGKQKVEAVYEDINTLGWSANAANIKTVTVVDSGILPTSTASWFAGFCACTAFDLEKLDTSQVTDMTKMFQGCSVVTELDLAGFGTGSVSKMDNMFDNCDGLETILVGNDWTVGEGTSGENMFASCTALKGGAGTAFVTEVAGTSHARIDGGTVNPGYLTYYKYAIVFEANHDKTISVPGMMLNETGFFEIPAEEPTHQWGSFEGWATTPEGTGTLYQKEEEFQSNNNTVPSCDKLYAVWDVGVTDQNNFATAVAQASGAPVVIGGGYWNYEYLVEDGNGETWSSEFNPDTNKRLNLTIWDGEFDGWLMYITNADVVINGGVFQRMGCFWNENATVTINGGTWGNVGEFTVAGDTFGFKITGGTFSYNISQYVANGYTVRDNGDGTWTVEEDSAVQ